MKKRKEQPRPSETTTKANPLSWFMFAVLCVMLLWSFRNFFDYGDLFAQLSGKPMIERGRIGANENRSFLARAGRKGTQRAYAETKLSLANHLAVANAQGRDVLVVRIDGQPVEIKSVRDIPSSVANGWAQVMQWSRELPPNSRVYLNFPSEIYYYFGNTIWAPCRVDINTSPVVTKDAATIRDNALQIGPDEVAHLRKLGFTHLLQATPQGIRLIPVESKGVSPQ